MCSRYRHRGARARDAAAYRLTVTCGALTVAQYNLTSTAVDRFPEEEDALCSRVADFLETDTVWCVRCRAVHRRLRTALRLPAVLV